MDQTISKYNGRSSNRQSRNQGDRFGRDNMFGKTATCANAGVQEKSVGLMAPETSFQAHVALQQGATAAATTSILETSNCTTSSEVVAEDVRAMKDEFEVKWRHLSEKVKDSGIEDLKTSFLTEIKKIQEIIQKPHGGARVSQPRACPPVTVKPTGVVARKDRVSLNEGNKVKRESLHGPAEVLRIYKVEDRLTKQEVMMDSMRDIMQQMQQDIKKLQPECNETFKKAKSNSTNPTEGFQPVNPKPRNSLNPPKPKVLTKPAPNVRNSVENKQNDEVDEETSSQNPKSKRKSSPPADELAEKIDQVANDS